VALPGAVAALLLALLRIGERSLWSDEYATSHAARISLSQLWRLADHVDALLTPYYVFMHVWITVFGDSASSLRLPSAAAVGVAAGATALIGRRLFGAGTGAVAGMLVAVLPSMTRYGQEARPYALAVAAATVATLLLLRALDEPTGLRWTAYSTAVVVTAGLHVVAALILVGHGLVMLAVFRRRGDFRLLKWFMAAGVAVTLLVPFVAKGAKQGAAIAWINAGPAELAQLPARLYGSFPVALLVVAAALGGATAISRRDRPALWLLVSWAALPMVLCYVTAPLLHLFLHRYMLFTVPACALLAAGAIHAVVGGECGIGRSTDGRTDRSWLGVAGGAVILAAAILVAIPGQRDVRRSPVPGEPDFRRIAAEISTRFVPGDAIAYSGTFRSGRLPMEYELRDRSRPADVFAVRTPAQSGQFSAVLCTDPYLCALHTQRIWLVTTNAAGTDDYAGMPTATARFLRGTFTDTEVRSVQGARLLLLVRRTRT
jgi:mannosyltransferase